MVWKILGGIRLFVKKCKQDHISAFAAQSAFFILLSVIPFLLLFISLLQYTPVTESMVLKAVQQTVPGYIAPLLVSVIHEMYSRSVGLISATAVAAVWASAKGIQFLSDGLNSVYDRMETRNYFRLRIRAMLYTLVLLVAIVLSLTLLVFGNSIQEFLVQYVPLVAGLTELVLRLRSLIMLVVLVLFFALLYKVLPNRKATMGSQLLGSVLCALGWSGFSLGLSVYVDYFNGFSMYGSLTTIALVMLWMYFLMYIVLVCGEINRIYEEYTTV